MRGKSRMGVSRFALASGAGLICALGAPSQAQDGSQAVERGEREQIVVTGTGTRAASDQSLQAVDVLSTDELVDRFDGSLGATLARVPGVSSASFGPGVGRPTIRGLSGDRVRILANGLGAIDVSAVSADHATSGEVLEAERIEILRGAAAIGYGGDAAGGVINVIDTRIAEGPLSAPITGRAYGAWSSVDEGRQLAALARASLGPIVLQLDGSRREAEDMDIPGFAESARLRAIEEAEEEGHDDAEHEDHDEAEAFGVLDNSSFTFQQLGLGASLVGDWGFFGLSMREYEGDYGVPGHAHEEHGEEEHEEEEEDGEDEEGAEVRLDLSQTRYEVRGGTGVTWGPFDQVRVAAATTDYQHVELEGDEIGTQFFNEGWEARAALINERGGRWSGQLGVSAFATDYEAVGEEAFTPPVETQDVAVFLAQRLDRGRDGFEGGIRLERRTLDAATGVSREFDTLSLAGGYFFEPTKNTFLGVNLSRSERAPRDAELFSDGAHAATQSFEIGDVGLGKETAWSLDGVYHLDLEPLHVEAGVFFTDYADFIFLAPTGETDPEEGLPIFRYLQDDAQLYGGELLIERTLGQVGVFALQGELELEYVHTATDTLGPLPRVAPFTATFGLRLMSDALDLSADVEAAAAQDREARFELPTDGFTRVNLGAEWRPASVSNVRLIVQARNVFDEEARLHASQIKDLAPEPGRSVRLAVSARF